MDKINQHNDQTEVDFQDGDSESSFKFTSPACGCVMKFDEEHGVFNKPIKLCDYHRSLEYCGIGRVMTAS